MTTTATKPKQGKSAPFPGEFKPRRALQTKVTTPLATFSATEQERLSDWEHAS